MVGFSVGLMSPLPSALIIDERRLCSECLQERDKDRERGKQNNFKFFLHPLLTHFPNSDVFVRQIRFIAG